MKRAAAVTAFLAIACTVVWAQTPGLTVEPASTHIGGSVTITGANVPNRGNRTVTITISPPSPGAPVVRRVQLVDNPGGDDHNTFELVEGPLAHVGIWKVEAKGPVPQVPAATGEFEVSTGAVAAAASVQAVADAQKEAEEFTGAAKAEIIAFTELPEKPAALAKVAELEGLVAGFARGAVTVGQQLDRVRAVMPALRFFPEMRDAMTDVAQRVEGPARQVKVANQELHYTYEEMNNAAEWARMFHFQKVGFQKALAIFQYSFTASLSIKSWASGKLNDVIQSVRTKLVDQAAADLLGMTPQDVAKARQAIADMEKVKGHIELALDPAGGDYSTMAKDAADKAANWLIDWIYGQVGRNCRMYKADLKGEYLCEYYARGVVYMIAKYPWTGELEVFFRKRQRPTDIVRVQGVLRGNFGWRTGKLYPDRTLADVPGMWGVGIVVPRPPYPQPWDFSLEIKGEGLPHGLDLEIEKTHYDIEWLKYGLISVLWSAQQLVPTVDLPELRVPGGHWFMTRVTETAGAKKRFEIPLVIDGDDVLLRHTFDRTMDYIEAREFRVFLKLEVDGKETGI